MVAFDANMLLLLLSPVASPPVDKSTGLPVTFPYERLRRLVQDIDEKKTRILIPTPALSECLVHAGAARAQYLKILQTYAVFRIVPFDSNAAIELAIMTEKAFKAGGKRGGVDAPWAKVKFDRQIVAIAKVEGAHTISSDDPHVKRFAEASGITTIGLAGCPVPGGFKQGG